MRNHYATPVEAFTTHCNRCQTCTANEFGFCATGFRLLREAANFAEDSQLPLFPREIAEKLHSPLVRAFLHRG